MKKQSEIKIKPLNAKFFNDLANKIYNPKTKKFLRLCEGTLTNGPDPTDKKRKMHCGLGELYFAMSGEHTGNLEEVDIVRLAMYNLVPKSEKLGQIQKLKSITNFFDKDIIDHISYAIEDMEYQLSQFLSNKELNIYRLLENIPTINDDCDPKFCGDDVIFLKRSKDVAESFRQIGKILSSIKPVKKSKK